MGTQVNYSWIPSTARVLVLDGFCFAPRGTFPCPQLPLSWPPKDPSDTLDFSLDISEAIAGNEGDAIADLDISILPNNPGDLVLNSSSADGDLAIMWFSAGIAGTVYQVTVVIGTNSGRVISRTINLPVVTLSNSPGAQDDLTDQLGNAITDQNDSPIIVTS
jgi:hypothetical protein